MSVSDEVKQRIDIVDFISRYTPLKKTGTTYKGLCPFHNERTPSFVVFPQSGRFHCFGGCASGGDVITFLMRKENLEFFDALRILAKEAGVELDEQRDAGLENQRAELVEINALAAAYFSEVLSHHAAAQPAREYLERRGIDAATQELFQLGYALDTWNSLRDYFSERGYSREQLLSAGLIKHNEERESIYDAFRGRVMIPIRERNGRIIGFGGRILGDGQPKYLNTAETPIFHKSRVVYGLELAYEAIREQKRVIIVEGYMDVIAAHQHGYKNVVACMGTALTSDQLRQLQRYSDGFVLALDADAAGQQATIRGLNQARQALTKVRRPTFSPDGQMKLADRLGANLFVTSMPAGRDPDDVIRQDPKLWMELVDKARPLVDFYFNMIEDQVNVQSARGKGEAVAELTPLIAELDDEIERQHYTQQLSRLVQIDEQIIASRVQASARTSHAKASRRRHPNGANRHRWLGAEQMPTDPASEEPPLDEFGASRLNGTDATNRPPADVGQGVQELEEHLLASLLREPELLVWLSGECERLEVLPMKVDDLQHVENQEVFRALKGFFASDEQWDLEAFQELLTGQLHGRLARLIAYGLQSPPSNLTAMKEDTLKALIRMRIQRLGAEIMHIRFLQEEATANGNRDDARGFLTTNNKNTRELFHLQRVLLYRGRHENGVRLS